MKKNCHNETNIEIINNNYAFKIPKNDAEKARKLLSSRKLLDPTRKTLRDENFVYFPIIFSPDLKFSIPNGKIVKKSLPKNKRFISVKNALKAVVPKEFEHLLPSSWDQIGNVIIVEIKKELENYKPLIGNALLITHPHIVAVYEKVSPVKGTIRTRTLRLIAGKPISEVIHQEYGIKICVDIHNTYFSPRLSLEHFLLASKIKEKERIADLFTGVGSFPLHIAKNTDAEIYAIDINAKAIDCLKKSIELNQSKLKGEIIPIVEDAKEWCEKQKPLYFDRIIMNHPSQSYEFLEYALRILKPNGILHFYSFEPISQWHWGILKKLQKKINQHGREINEVINIRKVRQYSPEEYHISCSLRIK